MKINDVYECNIAKFNTYSVALGHSEQRNAQRHPRGMFHGDDDLFWVVSGRDIKRLADAGYERVA